jgi:DNA polymerase III delta subunit
MIYFLYGNDTHKARAKLHEMLDALAKKRPDSEVFKLTSENWSEGQFDELLASQGLFDQKYIVVLDMLFEKKDIKGYILDRLEEAKAAEHVFLLLEGKTDAATIKKIEPAAAKSQEFIQSEDKRPSFNIFSITDKLVQKDKKGLWISYVDLLDKGASGEEIHGILFWQLKNMLLASRAKDPKETGLSPYAYKNALSGGRNFTEEELVSLSSRLVDITHRVRTGDGQMTVMLEKWILEL